MKSELATVYGQYCCVLCPNFPPARAIFFRDFPISIGNSRTCWLPVRLTGVQIFNSGQFYGPQTNVFREEDGPETPKHQKCTPESPPQAPPEARPPQAPPEARPPQAFAGEVTLSGLLGIPNWQHPGPAGSSRRIHGARIPAQCQRRGASGPLSGADKPGPPAG